MSSRDFWICTEKAMADKSECNTPRGVASVQSLFH